MDFVDEKCDVFDNDEENKFIYTDIYNEFIEHVYFKIFLLPSFLLSFYSLIYLFRWKQLFLLIYKS